METLGIGVFVDINKKSEMVCEGDVVFVCDPNLPRSQWQGGKVIRVYCGAVGVARHAEVNTATGAMQRPVSRLAVLDSSGVGVLRTTL